MLSNQVLQRTISEIENIAGDLALYGRWTDTVLYRREQRVRVPVRGFRRFWRR